jgi:hypothetical protein
MADMRSGSRKSFTDPIANLVAANAHATDPLTNGDCDAILVTAAGDIACRCVDGGADVTIALEKGWHPLRLSHVRAAGTTATLFVGYR